MLIKNCDTLSRRVKCGKLLLLLRFVCSPAQPVGIGPRIENRIFLRAAKYLDPGVACVECCRECLRKPEATDSLGGNEQRFRGTDSNEDHYVSFNNYLLRIRGWGPC